MATKSEGDRSKSKITVGVISKRHLLAMKRSLLISVIVLLAIAVAAILAVVLAHKNSLPLVVSTQSQGQDTPTPVPLTKEQKEVISRTLRDSGTVVAFSSDQKAVTAKLSSGKEIDLKIEKSTIVNVGNMGYPGKLADIKAGQSAVVSYDTKTNDLESIWVSYDK